MPEPGVRIAGEVGVVAVEDLLARHVGRKLDQEAPVAHVDVQGIDGFRLVEPLGRDVLLAQRAGAEVHEGVSQRVTAESALPRAVGRLGNLCRRGGDLVHADLQDR